MAVGENRQIRSNKIKRRRYRTHIKINTSLKSEKFYVSSLPIILTDFCMFLVFDPVSVNLSRLTVAFLEVHANEMLKSIPTSNQD